MTIPYYRRTTCRLCEESALETIWEFPPTPVGDHYIQESRLPEWQQPFPLALTVCRACGLVQLPDVVAPEILYGNYIYFTGISLGLGEHFRKYSDAVLNQSSTVSGSLVIDIGSNDGTLLKCFREKGMRVLGIDPAAEVAQKAANMGIETITAFFTPQIARQIREEHGPAAVVTANNVLANIDNVPDMITGVRSLLALDGIFVFETGYMPDLIQKTIIDNIYHEHISYYSVIPLDIFFRRHGMELVDVRHVPTKGGSIRGMVQLAGGPRPVSARVTAMIRLERTLGYAGNEPFIRFAEKLTTIRAQLLEMLAAFKTAGKSIAGYGASVGMTTMIYFFDLAPYLEYLVDDNGTRHRLYSPGLHLKVGPSGMLYETHPDYVVLLAWQYAGPIIDRHQKFLDNGGQFIIPLPEPRLV